ncbi:MAG: Para-aminobenzoate synthase, aminase component [Rhodanobacteraceae bacterium]|jgi:anthranilate synthase component 1|nr:MAG: Para-aminobenzoate synthase, aminase component [Rhodanobacteraceae bacterium]
MPGFSTAGAGRFATGYAQRELPDARDLLPLAARFAQRYPCLLESALAGPQARWDILFAFPSATLALHADGHVRNQRGESVGTRFLDALDAAWRAAQPDASRAQGDRCGPPFRGGWLLYLGYELAGEIEPRLRLPVAETSRIPIALAVHCPAAIMVDRRRGRTLLVAESGRYELLDALQDDLEAMTSSTGPDAIAPPVSIEEDDPARFLEGVARVHGYLERGDTFQVNLSRGWRARHAQAPAPASLYAALRRANPAPFAGLLQQPGWALASSSPERLLEIRDGEAQTRPIAGTRPRVAGDDDAARIRELVTHPKERAEHVMLIDLERNDLGRICMPGSIRVDERMVVESYAHVHHIVSNVRGRLREDVTPGQAIAAVFPGGTITGCPKVRCMGIIAELEAGPRGAYTGALGYLNHDGDGDLNILIRTLQLEGDTVTFRAGAGIVVDSVAEAELAETRAKARGLLRAFGAPS